MSSYLSSFSFSPPPTFQLLHKLDLAFSSLLQGTSVETGIPLPGFDGSRNKLSTTEKVRMRGLVERTRVAVVDVAGREESMMHDTSEVQSLTETDDDSLNEDADSIDWDHIDGGHGRWEMEIARVYEKTIEELGTSLDGTNLRAL